MQELISDERKLHHVGTISLKKPGCGTVEEKVWQITHDQIRVLWCYAGSGRIILLGRILLKKQKKTKPADVRAVEALMQSYIDAAAAGKLTVVGE